MVDGEEKRTLWGEKLLAGEEERFEFPIDAKGTAAISVGEGGGIEDDRVEFFLAAEKTGQDAAHVFGPVAVFGATEVVQEVIFFAADEAARGGIDVEGFGSDGSGDESEGAGVGEKIEEFGWAESAEVGAILALIGEKTWGDA